MSLQKKYLPEKPLCKITFKLSKDFAVSANRVNLTGDFNNWDMESMPMKKLKDGDFTITVSLETGHEYQFKYLMDGLSWFNETEADRQVSNGFQTLNSVIVV